MTTKMSPAEVMAKAAYDYWRIKQIQSNHNSNPPTWEQLRPTVQKVSIMEMRTALHALAEMEPAEEIRSHIHDVWAKAYMGDSTSEEACMLGCKTYILDAAKEGEPQ